MFLKYVAVLHTSQDWCYKDGQKTSQVYGKIENREETLEKMSLETSETNISGMKSTYYVQN